MRTESQRFRWLSTRIPGLGQRRLAVITGARQTGKTTLARRHYPELRYLNLDDIDARVAIRDMRSAAWASTVGEAVIDEAQKEPSVFDRVKLAYDEGAIDFSVLLGSSRILLLQHVRESLAGRAFLYDLWPLMASELRAPWDSPPERPLLDHLLDPHSDEQSATRSVLGSQPEVLFGIEDQQRREAWAHLGEWGGMPALLELDDNDRREWLRSYQQTFLERDLLDLARLSDLHPFRSLQRLSMLRTAQLLTYSELARDAQIAAATARRYLEYLRISYQVVLLQPYRRNLTSRVVKSPKLYWVDLGILRQATRQRGPLTGALFETLVIGEIHKWLSTMARGAELFYYRTRSGMEVDGLIETPEGVLGIEIKSRKKVVAADARGLIAVRRALGDDWRGGIVVYSGDRVYPLIVDDDIWAVPAFRLF